MEILTIIYVATISMLATLGSYHLMVAVGRNIERVNLMYSILVFSCAYMIFSWGIYPKWESDANFHIYYRETIKILFFYSAIFTGICSLLLFITNTLELKITKKIVNWYSLSFFIAIVILFIIYLNVRVSYNKAVSKYLFPVGTIVYIAIVIEFVLSKGYLNKFKIFIFGSSILYAISFMVMMVFNLSYKSNDNQIFWPILGIVTMSFAFAMALTKQFNEEHNELIDTKKNLEGKVIERTKDLEVANSQKTMTFINLAHEIKTPLTIIKNYFEKYKEKNILDGDLKEVEYNINVLMKDTVNFLDTEKLQRCQIFYDHSRTIWLSEILEKKVKSFTNIAEKHNLKISKEIDDSVYIKADIFAIDRVLNNVINNAIRYNKPSGLIHVILRKKDDIAEIVIKDTGVGIQKEHQENIFNPYYQVAQKKRNIQGIGMGLYITHEIIKALNGKIKVESEENVGTTFIIELEVCKEIEKGINEMTHISEPIDIPLCKEIEDVYNGDDLKTILIVEDSTSLLNVLKDNFFNDYNIFCAINGKEAISKIKNKEIVPDLIISDIMMDEMDGHEFLKEVQKIKELKGIPFIFLTAKTSEIENIEGLRIGAVDYITKPFSMEILKARVKSLLEINAVKKELFELEKFKTIGLMTASISHQILNPLSGIKGPLYVVEKKIKESSIYDDEKVREGINFIKENVNRISDIVETLRALFKDEKYGYENIKVKTFVESIISIFRGKISDRITFEIDIEEDFIINSNKSALTQIFMNLIGNAIEAIETSGKIHIKSNDCTNLIIQDNGCGIEEKNIKKIFELSFTSQKNKNGTGFGMYIVKEIAKRLQIEINIKSEIGVGTEITLIFGN